MDQRSEEFNQKLITFFLIGGIALVLLGIVGMALFFNPAFILLAILCVLMVLGGIGLIGASIFYGIALEKGTQSGPEVVEPNCRVMARYGVNSRNEMVSSDWATESDDFKPYVRLHSPRKGAMEFQCAFQVWDQCGEGMIGEAILQGRWLSSFKPYVAGVAGPQNP